MSLKQSSHAWFDKLNNVLILFGFSRCHSNHSAFVYKKRMRLMILIIYIDDIIVSGNDLDGIEEVKNKLKETFQTKDPGQLRYFLGIEVEHSRNGIILRKYVQDLLTKIGMLGSKLVDISMDPNSNLNGTTSEVFNDIRRYKSLVGKLIYLTVNKRDITFVAEIISQFMETPRKIH